MSSTWPPGPHQPWPTQPPPAAKGIPGWLIALIAVLLVATIIVWVLVLRPSGVGVDGGDGVGDPYFPQMGGGGYDTQQYVIDVAWDEASETLDGTTTITARATIDDLGIVHFDLWLPVEHITQDGRSLEFVQEGEGVQVTLNEQMDAGEEFAVTVEYAGSPQRSGAPGFHNTEGEIVIAHEPSSAPLWFPANDHPSDVALMDVTLRVPQGESGISVGRLESQHREGEHDVWRWVADQPMATYLNFLAIGDFTIEQGESAGRPYFYAVSNDLADADRAMTALLTTEQVISELEQFYGPYPFTEFGGVVPSADFPWGALENQTRPVYGYSALVGSPRQLVVHETAHMWFGNNVTLRHWDDIFMNEAFATHAEWLAEEGAGRADANAYFEAYYDALPDERWSVVISDPGADDLFNYAVYARGGMTLQALRNLIGDDAFFSLCRDWAQEPGSRSLEDFRRAAQNRTDRDLTRFFEVWVDTPQKPSPTPENGFLS